MNHHQFILLNAVLVTLLSVMGSCSKPGPPNRLDTTSPSIKFEVKNANNIFAEALETSLDVTGDLTVKVVFSDPDGLKSVKLEVTGTTKSCTGGNIPPGEYPIEPLQKPVGEVFSATNTLPIKVALYGNLVSPFKCKADGADGTPSSGNIILRATTENWSSNNQLSTTTKDFIVKLNDPTPPGIQFQIKNAKTNQFVPASEASLDVMESLTVQAVFSDPEGLRSVRLEFSGDTTNCKVDGSNHIATSYNFPLFPLPTPKSKDFPKTGNLPTTVALSGDLIGPFQCRAGGTRPGVDNIGETLSGNVLIQATALNGSSNNQSSSATKKFFVKLE